MLCTDVYQNAAYKGVRPELSHMVSESDAADCSLQMPSDITDNRQSISTAVQPFNILDEMYRELSFIDSSTADANAPGYDVGPNLQSINVDKYFIQKAPSPRANNDRKSSTYDNKSSNDANHNSVKQRKNEVRS